MGRGRGLLRAAPMVRPLFAYRAENDPGRGIVSAGICDGTPPGVRCQYPVANGDSGRGLPVNGIHSGCTLARFYVFSLRGDAFLLGGIAARRTLARRCIASPDVGLD